MTLLRGHFAMMLVCEGDADAVTVEEALAGLTEDGTLTVSVREVPAEAGARRRSARTYVLTVHGGDRPGIVSAIAAEVARVGGNITDLTTRLSGELYLLVAEVDLPAGVDADALRDLARGGGRRPRGRRHAAPAGERRPVSDERLVDDTVGRWDERDLGVDGRVLEVVRAPATVLATVGDTVDPTDPDVVRLAADLVATMRVSPGCVGLAAPQVGVGVEGLLRRRQRAPQDPGAPRHLRALQRRGRGVLAQREGPRGLHVGARPHR